MKISAISFCGVAKPFIDNNGNRIIPISEKPDEDKIKKAIQSTKGTAPFGQGCNGEAFYLGQDLIVKKHKGKDAYIKDNKREIAILDKMYDAKANLPNSQKGVFAIESPEATFIVSTKVKGDIIHPVGNPYNREKFANLLNSIAEMDKGFYLENSSKIGGSNRCRFMNYDFNMGNVLFDGNQPGFFDFESSKFENLDDMIKDRILGTSGDINPHRSDTSILPSNVRSFEFFALNGYLQKADNPYEILNDYLIEKGKYHQNMSEFYDNFANESKYKNIVRDISVKEKAHGEVLKPGNNGKISPDIMQAEIMKMQISRFIHKSSSHTREGQINQTQIKNYTNNAIKYFNEMLNESWKNKDKNRIIYYEDAISLMDDWKKINDRIGEMRGDEKYKERFIKEPVYTLDDAINDSSMPENIKKVLPKGFISNAQLENPVGIGANSKVYEIPNNNDYVLKILNKGDPNQIPVGLFPDDVNVGQSVWKSPLLNIQILKKVPGQEHSIPKWSSTIENPDTKMPEHISEEQANLFFAKTDKLASMSDEAFDELAKKVKLISDKGCKLDPINANNLIVSDDEINIIDFWKVNDSEKHIYQNSSLDIIAAMLDFALFPEYYEKLDNDKKEKLIQDVAIIRDKVNKASEKSGLDTGEEKFKTYIRKTSRWFPAHSVYENDVPYFRYYDVRMEDFLKMVRNPKEWAMEMEN